MCTPENKAPQVSIIVATYNAADTLERCLKSIIEQTYPSWELLIADGGSTDTTTEIIQRYAEFIGYWHSHPDNGIYDAWNRALAHASGEYICFLGADDIWADTNSLLRLLESGSTSRCDLVTSRGCFRNPTTGVCTNFGGKWDFHKLGRRMVVCHPGMLHRRSLFDLYGNFDTQLKIAGDLDFLLRLPHDIPTRHLDEVTVVVEAGGISRTNVLERLKEQRLVLSRSPRYGPLRAYLAWLDKLWRYPLARIFGILH